MKKKTVMTMKKSKKTNRKKKLAEMKSVLAVLEKNISNVAVSWLNRGG